MVSSNRLSVKCVVLIIALFVGMGYADKSADTRNSDPLPPAYDLRELGYVTPVKSQTDGTCWCHGTMAAIESNLLISGHWSSLGRTNWPNLAEYHLDWWNGFNQYNNDDMVPTGGTGLVVHEGGDYLVAAAYIGRGDGAVNCARANSDGQVDSPWYISAPAKYEQDYEVLYVRDIEWYTVGPNLEDIDIIKKAVVTHGAVATCMAYSASFLVAGKHYQSPSDGMLPNHSVTIVGWDDSMVTQAPMPGAWLIKNSWGRSWNGTGYFWISYYDKHCGHDPEMGAVSFQGAQLNPYDHIYYHDYHGWRDTKTDCNEAFNVFIPRRAERVVAVSFYTATDNVTYNATIYDRFEDGQLLDELTAQSGTIAQRGFHTVDLNTPVVVTRNNDFYVYVELSAGGHAYDRTSEVKVLLDGPNVGPTYTEGPPPPDIHIWSFNFDTLGKMQLEASQGALVPSTSEPGQSYYRSDSGWRDLYEFDNTANFCIKALAVSIGADLNQDAVTDFADFGVLASAWKTEAGDELWDPSSDLNRDNAVDAQDIAIFATQWLQQVFPPDLVAYWKLDELTGSIAHDSVRDKDGTLNGDALWEPTAGKVKGAIQFDGIDDYVSTPFVLNPVDGAFSVLAWVKGGGPGQAIISQAGGVNWLAAGTSEGKLMTELKAAGRFGTPLSSEAVIIDGEWHRVGLTWDGTNRILYVDGVEVAKGTESTLGGSASGLYIGAGSVGRGEPGSFWFGLIDDVRIYDRAITP